MFEKEKFLNMKNVTIGGELFFETVAAKALSGLCSFLALFITGHQVNILFSAAKIYFDKLCCDDVMSLAES